MTRTPLDSQRFHLIGIGGHGMSVIAELLFAQGATVSGSDREHSAALAALQDMGIGAYTPHEASRLHPDATVVVSTAISEANPELALARARGQRVIHRSEALALAASKQKFVAVAGTHGKTTSTAMIAVALLDAGYDPSFAIGSAISGVGTGARLGSDFFVAEADESDKSFLNYSPCIELITNIEPEHVDVFGSEKAFFEAFRSFAKRLEPGGTLICSGQDAGSASLAKWWSDQGNKTLTFGRPQLCESAPDVAIVNATVEQAGTRAVLRWGDIEVQLALEATGEHNLLNASGAWATLVTMGVEPEVAAKGLASFKGTDRRFQVIGTDQGRTLVDDYAHHPTEVSAAIKQARLAAGDGNVVVVFEPHLYSRTAHFSQGFADALATADRVFVSDIDPAREQHVEGVDAATIIDLDPTGTLVYGGSVEESVRRGAAAARSGDLLVLMGPGGIYRYEDLVMDLWAKSGPA